MMLAKNIFKAYDIRGIYEEELSINAIKLIAKSLSHLFPENNDTIIVGRDGRNSSSKISETLIESFLENGKNIINVGEVPTPLVYFARNYLNLNSCIMVTGSHNPKNYNGLKIFMDGHTLSGGEIKEIYDFILRDSYSKLQFAKTTYKEINLKNEYISQIIKNISIINKKKIAVDAGNGVAGPIAIETYKKLGFDVVDLYCDIDGDFPNHHPNPSDPKNLEDLADTVKNENCDLGIAFDGDGDRVVMVDHRGNVVDGDEILYLIARDRRRQSIDIGGVVGTQMSNLGLELALDALDVPFVRSKVGDRFVMKDMLARDWKLGGESSGHIICLDIANTGDGIISSLQALAALVNSDQSLSDARAKMRKFPQCMINVRAESSADIIENSSVKSAISEIETKLGKNGRVLLRQSGTEPVIRVMVEGEDGDTVDRMARELSEIVTSQGAAG